MGLPRSFDVDPKALEASYRALQAQLHPDKHHHHHHHRHHHHHDHHHKSKSSSSSSTSSNRASAAAAAAEASAAVNAAVALLRCPLARARFLLDGARPDRDDGHDHSEEKRETIDDPELLMEVMEAREEVEEAAAAEAARRKSGDENDGSENNPLALLRDKHARAAQDLSTELSSAFASGDLGEARRLSVRLRYATRILQAVREKM